MTTMPNDYETHLTSICRRCDAKGWAYSTSGALDPPRMRCRHPGVRKVVDAAVQKLVDTGAQVGERMRATTRATEADKAVAAELIHDLARRDGDVKDGIAQAIANERARCARVATRETGMDFLSLFETEKL